jgi:hypothetical protein
VFAVGYAQVGLHAVGGQAPDEGSGGHGQYETCENWRSQGVDRNTLRQQAGETLVVMKSG